MIYVPCLAMAMFKLEYDIPTRFTESRNISDLASLKPFNSQAQVGECMCRKIDNWGGEGAHIYMFVFTDLENN